MRATIEDPDVICQSAKDVNRYCFYSIGAATRYPDLLVKVVVERIAGQPAEVRTALLVKGIPRAEVMVWQKIHAL